jgi:hypothetical protein
VGFEIIRPSKSAIVRCREGPLEEGVEETFQHIGIELAKMM